MEFGVFVAAFVVATLFATGVFDVITGELFELIFLLKRKIKRNGYLFNP